MNSKTEVVYVVTGFSESSDHYGPRVFSKKPNDTQLSQLAHNWEGDPDGEGPGFDGSYVDISVFKCVVEEELTTG